MPSTLDAVAVSVTLPADLWTTFAERCGLVGVEPDRLVGALLLMQTQRPPDKFASPVASLDSWERSKKRKFFPWDGQPGTGALKRQNTVAALMGAHGAACVYCGVPLKATEATIDHIVPLAAGGGTGRANAALACRACNLAKGARTPAQWLADLQYGVARLEALQEEREIPLKG